MAYDIKDSVFQTSLKIAGELIDKNEESPYRKLKIFDPRNPEILPDEEMRKLPMRELVAVGLKRVFAGNYPGSNPDLFEGIGAVYSPDNAGRLATFLISVRNALPDVDFENGPKHKIAETKRHRRTKANIWSQILVMAYDEWAYSRGSAYKDRFGSFSPYIITAAESELSHRYLEQKGKVETETAKALLQEMLRHASAAANYEERTRFSDPLTIKEIGKARHGLAVVNYRLGNLKEAGEHAHEADRNLNLAKERSVDMHRRKHTIVALSHFYSDLAYFVSGAEGPKLDMETDPKSIMETAIQLNREATGMLDAEGDENYKKLLAADLAILV